MSTSDETETMINLENLSVPQLSQFKKQLDDELEHLTASFSQLRAAQTKFRDCSRSIENGVTPLVKEKPILVALTTSLYVPGTLADPDNIIVDIGTGYYIEKSTKDAIKFYENRSEEITSNLKILEGILQGKSNNLRVLEEVLRQKLLKVRPTGESEFTAK